VAAASSPSQHDRASCALLIGPRSTLIHRQDTSLRPYVSACSWRRRRPYKGRASGLSDRSSAMPPTSMPIDLIRIHHRQPRTDGTSAGGRRVYRPIVVIFRSTDSIPVVNLRCGSCSVAGKSVQCIYLRDDTAPTNYKREASITQTVVPGFQMSLAEFCLKVSIPACNVNQSHSQLTMLFSVQPFICNASRI